MISPTLLLCKFLLATAPDAAPQSPAGEVEWKCVCVLRDMLSPRIRERGGNPERLLPSLRKGREALTALQKSDGSWSSGKETSLAVLATLTTPTFMGNPQRRESVIRALGPLSKAGQDEDVETRAYRIWALCQAYGWIGNYSLEDTTLEELRAFIKLQRGNGGFAASAREESGVRLSRIGLEALASGHSLWPREPGLAEALQKTQEFIGKAAPEKDEASGLETYLRARQAYRQGGQAWAEWQREGEDELLRTQQKDGLWTAAPGETNVGSTAFALLSLSLYFEVLPEARRDKPEEQPKPLPEEEVVL
ncbi:MAG: hypothetical protein RL095_3100 [Verrucomicrobiota bacterium]|jgi:hypothetical protein